MKRPVTGAAPETRQGRRSAVAAGSPGGGVPLSGVRLAAGLMAALALVKYLEVHTFDPLGHELLWTTLAPLFEVTAADLLVVTGRAALAALVLLAQLLAAWGFGGPAIRLTGLAVDRAEGATAATLLGLAAYAFGAWAIGILGFYSAASFATLLGLGGALAVVSLLRQKLPAELLRLEVLRDRWRGTPRWIRWSLLPLGLLHVGALGSGFTPPHISDEMIYHLGYADWYTHQGRIVRWPNVLFEAYPQLDTLHYATPLAFGLTFGIKWSHWAAGWIVAALLALSTRGFPMAARRVAVLVWLLLPAVWGFTGRAFNDVFITAYAAGALWAGVRARGARGHSRDGWALLAGLMIGLGACHKYTMLLMWMTLLPFLPIRGMVIAGVAAGVVVSPWLIRNWIVFMNPVYPYLYHVLGGLGWDDHLAWRISKVQLQGEFSLWQKVRRLPVSLFNIPAANWGSGPDGSSGPLFAMTLGLILAGAGWRDLVGLSALYLPVALGAPGLRFLFPIVPLLLRIAAAQLGEVRAGLRLRQVGAAGFVLLGLYQAGEFYQVFWRIYDDPLHIALRQAPMGRWLDRRLYPSIYYPPSYSRGMEAVEARVPRGERMLVLGGYGGVFYFHRHAIFNPLEGRPLPIPLAREAADFNRLAVKFRQYGIRWVLVNRQQNDIFFDFWKMWDWKPGFEATRWINYWDHYARRVWRHGNQLELYRLRSSPELLGHQTTPGLEEETTRLLVYIIRKGEAAIAENVIKGMRPLFPRNPQLWLRDAETNVRKGDLLRAKTCCDTVEYLAPNSMDLFRCRAAVAAANGDFKTAARLLQLVVAREAWDAQSWLDLSQVSERLGDLPGAKWAKFESELRKEFRWERW